MTPRSLAMPVPAQPTPSPPPHPEAHPSATPGGPASGADDAAGLLRLASRGDDGAWTALVRGYSGRVFGLLYQHCRDRDLAEEITQATFVKLFDTLHQPRGYDERGRFEPFLFRVALNALRDEMRRRRRHAQPLDMTPGAASGRSDEDHAWAAAQHKVLRGGPAPAADPGDHASRREQIDRLRDAVAGLPEADREVLHLRHTAGMSFADIADTLGQPLGTVLARAHRALGKLRKILDDEATP